MGIYLLLDLKEVLFLPSLPSKFTWEVEFWYVHSTGVLDAPFWSLDYSAPFYPLTAQKSGLLVWFSFFFEFVLRITHLQIGAREAKLSMYI